MLKWKMLKILKNHWALLNGPHCPLATSFTIDRAVSAHCDRALRSLGGVFESRHMLCGAPRMQVWQIANRLATEIQVLRHVSRNHTFKHWRGGGEIPNTSLNPEGIIRVSTQCTKTSGLIPWSTYTVNKPSMERAFWRPTVALQYRNAKSRGKVLDTYLWIWWGGISIEVRHKTTQRLH